MISSAKGIAQISEGLIFKLQYSISLINIEKSTLVESYGKAYLIISNSSYVSTITFPTPNLSISIDLISLERQVLSLLVLKKLKRSLNFASMLFYLRTI